MQLLSPSKCVWVLSLRIQTDSAHVSKTIHTPLQSHTFMFDAWHRPAQTGKGSFFFKKKNQCPTQIDLHVVSALPQHLATRSIPQVHPVSVEV